MLKRIRIEVEEDTAQDCVDALMKYEHAVQQQEARRYRETWPVTLRAQTSDPGSPMLPPPDGEAWELEYPTPDLDWGHGWGARAFFDVELGREVTEEVIEFDASIPGYRARRVVQFTRVDMRAMTFLTLTGDGLLGTVNGMLGNSGTGVQPS